MEYRLRKLLRLFTSIIIIMALLPSSVLATTYFVSASVANDNGNGIDTPKKYIESGIRLLRPGDTLIVKDGLYQTSNDQITNVPNGTAENYVTIKAENDGGAVITANNGFDLRSSYVQIEGMKVIGGWEKGIDGNHQKILRCAFSGGPSSGNTINFAFSGSYNLMEDCWFYGSGGRYKVLIYRANHNVMRRCIVRQDAGWRVYESDPEAGICIYESSNISIQNFIVIDSTLSYTRNYVGAYYLTGHWGNPSSDNIEYLGCMAVNNKGEGWHVDTDDGGVGLVFRDVVVYGQDGDGISTSNTSMDMTIRRATIGEIVYRAIANWGSKNITVIDSVLWHAGQSHKGSISATYTNTYSPNDFSGAGITHVNPLTNGLSYLPRIETGSTLQTSGKGGGQKGAQIIKRIGTSGTLYGETGYNTLTDEDLWPWANESRIKADMAAVSSRGFCATGQTLTKYIWERLGNVMPPDLGGENPGNGSGSNSPPAAPTGLRVIDRNG